MKVPPSLAAERHAQALVAGANLVLAMDTSLSLTNMNFLSANSRCYSFDERANGYSRGEGFGVVVIKRISDAVRDGDTIRAIIRSTERPIKMAISRDHAAEQRRPSSTHQRNL